MSIQEQGGQMPPPSFNPHTLRELRHDVRTPLNAVLGIAALLQGWQGLDERQRRMVEVLASSSNDLHKRLDALFDYLDANEAKGKPAETPAPSATPQPLATGRRVLLAEDYQPNALVARTFLEDMGYEVDLARDGLEAVARFGEKEYSAVLLDVQMPELDGLEAARRMRSMEQGARRSRTPIIALTAHATRDDALFCMKAGMDDYLSKPFNATQLSEKLSTLGQARPA